MVALSNRSLNIYVIITYMSKNIAIVLLVLAVIYLGVRLFTNNQPNTNDPQTETTTSLDPSDTTDTDSSEPETAQSSGDEAFTASDWQNKTWLWVETVMNNDDIIKPIQTEAFTITFTDRGQVNGGTDCNSFGGSYELLPDNGISFGNLAMTKMYCENSQEQVFVNQVTSANKVFMTDDGRFVLLLPYDSGSIIFSETN